MLNVVFAQRKWTPRQARGISDWWNPRAPASMIVSGGVVSSFTGLVRGHTMTQAVGAQCPAFNPSAFGTGWPGLDYDGADDCLERAAIGSFPSGALSGEMWAVVKQAALAANTSTRVAVSAGNTTNNQRQILRVVTTGVNRLRTSTFDGTTLQSATDTTVDFSARHIVRAVFNPTSLVAEIDGVTTTTVITANSTATSRTRFGANPVATAAQFWSGSIADVVTARDALLNESDAKRMRDYFQPMVA